MPKFERDPSAKKSNVIKIFNYAGAALIFFGIAFFISINWYSLNDFVKIFSTLGAAIAAFTIGVLLHIDRKREATSSAFFMIAGLLLPIGLYVTLKVFDLTWADDKTDLLITSTCLCIFLLADLYSPRTILLLFCIIFAALFFLSLIEFITQLVGIFPENLLQYELMILGISAILFGRYLDFEKTYPLTGLLYFFGALFLLASSFLLSESFSYTNGAIHWRVLTAILIILAFALSVPLRSKSFLYLGAIFLVLYILDMSYRFARVFGNMGWPLLLIVAGFLLIILGYFIFYIHGKISRKKSPKKDSYYVHRF